MSTEQIPVVILCGGQGTRMQAATNKVLTDIGGRPILWHVMRIYATYGHSRFILALGHQGEEIKRYFLEYNPMSCDFTVSLGHSGSITYHGPDGEADWQVTLADTGAHVEKGTRIRRVARVDAVDASVTIGEALDATVGEDIGASVAGAEGVLEDEARVVGLIVEVAHAAPEAALADRGDFRDELGGGELLMGLDVSKEGEGVVDP